MPLKIPEHVSFVYLTASLIALLFLIAVAEKFAGTLSDYPVKGALIVTLTIAILTVRRGQGALRIGLTVIGVFVLLEIAGHWIDFTSLRLLQLALLFTYFAAMAGLAFKQVLFMGGSIDANRLLGAVSVYLLLGFTWAVIYLAVLEVDPAALNGIEPGQWGADLHELLYFSFVTLTTLGYGDISPAGPVTRVLVYLEAILGQLYLAIMIAGLVGIGISSRMQGPSKTE